MLEHRSVGERFDTEFVEPILLIESKVIVDYFDELVTSSKQASGAKLMPTECGKAAFHNERKRV